MGPSADAVPAAHLSHLPPDSNFPSSVLPSSDIHLPNAHLFPPLSMLPPSRPNTDPRCNCPIPNISSICQPVVSPLKADVWAAFLADYPDSRLVTSLIQIINYGANVGYDGPDIICPSRNLGSARNHSEFVDSAVQQLLDNQQVHGPFSKPPLPSFRCSPIGVVSRKRNPNKLRLINHLSWPRGTSVNDGIPDSEAAIHYDTFERAVEDMISSGVGSLMAKLDLRDAFRHIPIRADDWRHMGLFWDDKFYYCIVLTFGLRSAPYIFNLFAEALHWIIARHIPAHLRHYLDDFLLIFRPQSEAHISTAAVEWVMGLGSALGLQFQESKTVWPSTTLEFLGLELDSVAMEARLPADKLVYLQDLLTDWASRRRASLQQIQELAGFLQFTSQVIPVSRSFLRRIFDFMSKFRTPFELKHIPSGVRADLNWWRTFSRAWNGVRLLQPSRHSVDVYTDASGTKGIGGIFGLQWYASRVPRRYRERDIHFKEAFAILQAILRWGDEWTDLHVKFFCDNQNVVSWLTSGTSRSPQSMAVVRLIFMMAACLNFSFSIIWIPSEENALADAASRFQYSRLFQLAPYLQQQSSPTKSQLCGMRRTLTSHDASPSTYGTALHPALEKPTALARNRTLISSAAAPACSLPLDSICQPQTSVSWNGSHRLVTGGSSQRLLKATSPVFVPSMLTLEFLSKHVNQPRSSGLSVVSSATTASANAIPNSPSCSPFFRSSQLSVVISTSLKT